MFDAIFHHEFGHDTARKCVKFKYLFPKITLNIPDSFNHQLFQKLFWHNVRMPTLGAASVILA